MYRMDYEVTLIVLAANPVPIAIHAASLTFHEGMTHA